MAGIGGEFQDESQGPIDDKVSGIEGETGKDATRVGIEGEAIKMKMMDSNMILTNPVLQRCVIF